MAGLFENLSKAFSEGLSDSTAQSVVENQRSSELSKLEAQIKDIDVQLQRNYTLLGQEVATCMRQDQAIESNQLAKFFSPIQSLDIEKQKILDSIQEVKAKQAEQLKAQEMIRVKKEIEAEMRKIQELNNLGVLGEEEFEISQAKLKKRNDNFEKIYNLKIAFERGLINQEEYMKRKAALE